MNSKLKKAKVKELLSSEEYKTLMKKLELNGDY